MKPKSSKPPKQAAAVRAWQDTVTMPTYEPAPPDKNPMFLEKRVYQGSSGRVYPLPVIDRIAERPTPRTWKAIWIENEFLQVLVLPELGGRIHRLLDKTNGYDLIYHQTVIKPALVGLAGPWISGGIEFNWPQHHRPATFMLVDTEIERHDDGSVTVWCSDHDPLQRMKGMHGVCLHPGRAYLELKVRACNRTPFTQTFLWWANVATRVHEAYQSFFPPDVYYVADHARRSMSEYPLAQGRYYGVDYGARGRKGVPASEAPAQYAPPHGTKPASLASPTGTLRTKGSRIPAAGCPLPAYAANDLSFYANIPVPTSYMCMGSQEDFFGGYDYKAQAGIIHFADHHIAPGKKQWTWGNHEFGYAWDRNLTDPDSAGEHAPYIELMAGVFTDNQPDFSFLQPGETKAWSQYWYPIQRIGPAQQANLDAAVSLRVRRERRTADWLRLGVAVTRTFRRARIELLARRAAARGKSGAEAVAARRLARFTRDLAPGRPFVADLKLPRGVRETDLRLRVTDQAGHEVIAYQARPRAKGEVPPPATEPPAPCDITSADELFVTGLHLDQYRHATRCPTLYWREALRRDPGDARCNNGLGLWHLKRGEFPQAAAHFRRAIARLTCRNANPVDGEPFYNLGLCLRYQADALVRAEDGECSVGKALPCSDLLATAYAAFAKAAWNAAWTGPACHALAELDCRRGDWDRAAEHLEQSNCAMGANPRAMNLWAMVVRLQGKPIAAEAMFKLNRLADPLDWWTRHQLGEPMTCDTQTLLDLALDYARAGLCTDAIALLEARAADRFSGNPAGTLSKGADPRDLGTGPLVHYYLGWLHAKQGDPRAALAAFTRAAAWTPDYCFPARLEELGILEAAMAANPDDSRAPYYLGNLLYDRRRHEEAIWLWERSAKLDHKFSVVWRNLGIGYFNIRRQPANARAAYDRACKACPSDARLLYERDQLWKRLGELPRDRLRELKHRQELVRQRNDLSVEVCELYNQVGRHAEALALLSSRRFQPWEGGEGGPLGQWVRSHLLLGRNALDDGEAALARRHFEMALTSPVNLGEAKHLLSNQSNINYWLGCACADLGDTPMARRHWRAAATFRGDFQKMNVRAFSEMTYYSALAWQQLGEVAKARKLLRDLLAHAREQLQSQARIDYFATSLPAMLLFEDDLQFRSMTTALFLQAQAALGLGSSAAAAAGLRQVLERDPNHTQAADLARAPVE